MQCNHYNQPQAHALINQGISEQKAMSQTRCIQEVVPGYTKCKEHGGGDIKEFFSRDLQPDEKKHFRELFDNVVEKHGIDTNDMFILDMTAIACREIVLSHNSDSPGQHLEKALVLGNTLLLTPKEKRGEKLVIDKPIQDIESIVKARIAMTE